MCFFGMLFLCDITLKGVLFGQNEAQKKALFHRAKSGRLDSNQRPLRPELVRYRAALHPENKLPGQKFKKRPLIFSRAFH